MILGEARADGLKSFADHQQSAKYCRQLQSRLCGQLAQRLLPRTCHPKVYFNILQNAHLYKTSLNVI